MASAEAEQPSVDAPDEEFDLTKPYWMGYFRLPWEDVKSEELFEPKYELLPKPKDPTKPIRKPPCKLKVGKWVNEKEDGQVEEKKVLVKSIDMLHEREARILSSVSGSDALAKTFNIVRFYGATINDKTKEYNLVLEPCDMYLQDYVLDKSHTPDPLQWQKVAKSLCKQIANGMRYLHWKAPYNPIIHRDLHPLSVLIKCPNGEVIAKLFGFQHAKILGEHETVGLNTVAPTSVELWQAPEYVQRPSETKKSSPSEYRMVDVYSYAMLVWHILTRQLPYGGKKMVLHDVTNLLDQKERPGIPDHIHVPEFWRELMTRAWQDELRERPDFIKIYKAIENEDVSDLEPHRPLGEESYPPEEGKRPDWQLDPKKVPQANDRIISNKTKSWSVVYESKDEKVVLKKPIKENGEVPTEEEFKRFMEFSAELKRDNHLNILRYNGVFFLESLQMPLMRCSVRHYLEGKTVKREVKCDKEGANEKPCTKPDKTSGWGSMKPECVKQVAVGVAKGLSYLHTVKNVSHDGLSSSNVLLNYKGAGNIEEVKLVDYQLGLLGTSSQSHADRKCMYEAPKGTDPKRADLYSLGVLMVYMYAGEPKKKADWKKKKEKFEKDAVCAEMWEVVSKCLNIEQSLTADDVASALEANMQ